MLVCAFSWVLDIADVPRCVDSTVRGLTAQVERVTLREQAHAALLTREVESVTRRAEAFIAEHRTLSSSGAAGASTQTEPLYSEEDAGREGEGGDNFAAARMRLEEEGTGEAEAGVGGGDEEDTEADIGRVSVALASIRERARSRWTSREEEVAARVAEIERVRERLRVVERERDEELEALRVERDSVEARQRGHGSDTERVRDREMDMVRERMLQRQLQREEEREREEEMEREQQSHALQAVEANEREYAHDEQDGVEDGGEGGERVSDMQGELQTMRAEHARLLARRDAEIESVAAVEARCVCKHLCVFSVWEWVLLVYIHVGLVMEVQRRVHCCRCADVCTGR